MALPAVPSTLKPVQHYMKVAAEHDVRDPVVAYWARFHAVQKALTIDRNSPPAKTFLMDLLSWLEGKKKELHSNEAITNETVAQAHVENYVVKLFKYADDADRKGVFNKNTIKAFYTSSMLIDVLENFGEVSEEFERMRKYGKWKAAYIHNCLKNGETPVAGPVEFDKEEGAEFGDEGMGGGAGFGFGQDHQGPGPSSSNSGGFENQHDIPSFPPASSYSPQQPQFPAAASSFPSFPVSVPQPQGQVNPETQSLPATTLSIDKITQAQKYCKYAGSALNFDDVSTAIVNLRKALHLLETGKELPE